MAISRWVLCAGGLAWFGAVAGAETIYRCDSPGGLIFSDRPCAADASVHESDGNRVTVYDAPSISKRASQPRSKSAPRTAKKNADAHARQQAACARLDRSLRELRAKLRTGYGVKEGERLKARQRQLAEQRRSQKCR